MYQNLRRSTNSPWSQGPDFVNKSGGKFNTILELTSILLASIGIYFLVICFYSNQWRQNTQRGLVIESIKGSPTYSSIFIYP